MTARLGARPKRSWWSCACGCGRAGTRRRRLRVRLSHCSGLTALPAELGALMGLHFLRLSSCPALHTPPPRVVAAGTDAVLAFLRDLGGGFAPCLLVKLVLLGEQRSGKSSLADSLVRGRPATRPVDDCTVSIDVRRWWLGAGQGKGASQKTTGPLCWRSSCTSCAATRQRNRRSRRCSSGWRRCSRRRQAR